MKFSEWFDNILKKKLPRGVTVIQIDTADLPELTNGIKQLEDINKHLMIKIKKCEALAEKWKNQPIGEQHLAYYCANELKDALK